MLPEGIEGLLVACGAVSATNVAFSAIRMEPAYMALGQAAGTAAALAVDHLAEQREVVVLFHQHEWPLWLIAEQLEIPLGTDAAIAPVPSLRQPLLPDPPTMAALREFRRPGRKFVDHAASTRSLAP